MRYRSVLFDLDGTLVDNREGILNGFRHALSQLGRKDAAEKVSEGVIGPPLRDTFQVAFGMNEEQTEEAIKVYREYYRPIGVYQCTVYPGVEDLLHGLKQAGAGIYLATSKARVFAETILKHKELHHYFDGVAGSEMDGRLGDKAELLGHMIKAVIMPGHLPAVMVGDRSHDANGARECGLDAVAALWGFGLKEEFKPYQNVKAMFGSASDLREWLLGESV